MIYLDNAATSFPKPNSVCSGVYRFMNYYGAGAGRSAHKSARRVMELVWQAREEIADLICTDNPERIVFTYNTTHALNTAILGLVRSGDHVVISPVEHNSVVRPLHKQRANISVLPLKKDGSTDMGALAKFIRMDTKLVIINHASNVSGVVNDIEAAARICNQRRTPLLIDAAQTMGVLPIHALHLKAMVAFPGHKSLLSPQGTGGLYIPPHIKPDYIFSGGTGSQSESYYQPDTMPDRYESGTLNAPGIVGLLEGVKYIKLIGIEEIYGHEMQLTKQLIEGLSVIPKVKILCPGAEKRVSTVSIVIDGMDCNEVAMRLDEEYDVAVRSGMHCAPMAHKAYGTLQSGTTRLSLGYFNTAFDIERALTAISEIARG